MNRALGRGRLCPIAVAAFLLGAVGFPGCTTSGRTRPETAVEAELQDGVQRATVALHSFYFEPNRVVVRVGVPVELTLQSKAVVVPHNFTLRAPEAGIDVDQDVGAIFGTRRVVRFTPTRAGEYPFLCGKGSHMAKGMTGVLEVREAPR